MATRANASIVLLSLEHKTNFEKILALRQLGYSKSGAYNVLAAAAKEGEVVDKRQDNGCAPKISGCALGGLVASFNNKTGKSLRKSARKFNVCHKTIANTLRRAGITCKKRRKAPLYKQGQEAVVTTTLGTLYREHLLSNNRNPPFIIMDDETYITANDSSKFANSKYYSKDDQTTPASVKCVGVEKFPLKLGLWYAVSDCGISEWFIWRQGLAINAQIYKSQCLQRRLIPFIENNGVKGCSVFWPDKASAHYATTVLHYLNYKQVRCVPKSANPTNVPQCRPIEKMHAEIKRRVFLNQYRPKSADDFQARLEQVMQDFQSDAGNFTMGFSRRVRRLVRNAYREGVYSVHR